MLYILDYFLIDFDLNFKFCLLYASVLFANILFIYCIYYSFDFLFFHSFFLFSFTSLFFTFFYDVTEALIGQTLPRIKVRRVICGVGGRDRPLRSISVN